MNAVAEHYPAGDGISVWRHRQNLLVGPVVFVLAVGSVTGSAQELNVDEAKEIARDAYIYGFPIVENYKAMYASAIDKDGEQYYAPFNMPRHRSHVFTPTSRAAVTPNIDTPYSLLWIDLRAEPLVLGVPDIDDQRYYSIQLIDLFKSSFAYIGSRTNGNGSGRYLLAGPDWQGELPANIDKVLRCETQFALAVYRTQLRGPDDLDKVKNIQDQYTVETLSDFVGQPNHEPATTIEFAPPPPDFDPGLTFFSTLSFLLQFCPAQPSEEDLIKRLSRIGLSTDSAFDAATMSPETQAALKLGIQEGKTAIASAASTMKVAEVLGTREQLGNDYLKRAVAAKIGRYSNSREVIIPLSLIVIMSWLPRGIDPEQSGANIGISTSAFLTLVAYLFAITVLLPRVSYITRMDRFILLSTLTVFAGLIQTVANTVLLKKQRKQWVEQIDRWSRVVYPIILLSVVVVSFVL
ncbi:DUF1254 domain-containing protein [Pirellulales bacterium]|nr:DUF1254 domain-containing protein [Pirellulales bacterium]